MVNQSAFLALMGNRQLYNQRQWHGNCKIEWKKLGKLLQFTKFTKVFYHRSFLLYGALKY